MFSQQNNSDPWKGKKNKKYLMIFHEVKKKLGFFREKGFYVHKPQGNKWLLWIMIIILTIIIWFLSGLYSIKEAERGIVIRFGKFHHIIYPGLNWKLNGIDTVRTVNVKNRHEFISSGIMLTSDLNLVFIAMNVQYLVTNPNNYFFSVTNPDYCLRQATDSALREVMSKYNMDSILTSDRKIIPIITQRKIEKIISPYKMGITLVDLNFKTVRPPEKLKADFADAIAARENARQYICEAETYAKKMELQANIKAQHILEEAFAYKARLILEAQGEVTRFYRMLSEYNLSPTITRGRLYIETIEYMLSHTNNILVNYKGNNLFILPLKYFSNQKFNFDLKKPKKLTNQLVRKKLEKKKYSDISSQFFKKNDDIFNQRRENAERNNIHKNLINDK
ncbi:MAG: FtsH protease activity modulator HflK [Candidatus Dasytiphilus stammeri]